MKTFRVMDSSGGEHTIKADIFVMTCDVNGPKTTLTFKRDDGEPIAVFANPIYVIEESSQD